MELQHIESDLKRLRTRVKGLTSELLTVDRQLVELIEQINISRGYTNNSGTKEIVTGTTSKDRTGQPEISICGVFRNNGAWLRTWALNRFKSLEQDLNIKYYFYENDSRDSTKHLLHEFMHGTEAVEVNRRGRVVCENTKSTKIFKRDTSLDRIQNIANARNNMLELRPFYGEWTLMLDSETYFPPDLIHQFLDMKIEDDVVAVSCNGKNKTRCKHHINKGCRHYYDTLAMIDRHGVLGFNYSAKNGFSCCHLSDEFDREKWASGEPVEVLSAFGGACFYRTEILNRQHLKYEVNISHPFGASRKKMLHCEHWDFHEQLREYGRIISHPELVVSNEINLF